MALSWPTPQSILRKLPLDAYEPEDTEPPSGSGSKGVTESDVQGYIGEFVHELRQGSKSLSEPTVTPTGVAAVERWARASALQQIFDSQGQESPRNVESLRAEARRLLAIYQTEVDLPGEADDDSRHPDEEDGVLNFTDEALWDARNDSRSARSYDHARFYGDSGW